MEKTHRELEEPRRELKGPKRYLDGAESAMAWNGNGKGILGT